MNKRKVQALKKLSNIVSVVFTPTLIPFVAFYVLFGYSYLKIPFQYRLIVLSAVFCFTVVMPVLSVYLFRRINQLTPRQMNEKRRRVFPYVLTIISYAFCLLIMYRIRIPWYMTGVILAALVIMTVLLLCNFKWRLSEHMAGMGGIIGGLVSYGYFLGYNPIWWISVFVLISGLVGTARIISRSNTFAEVLFGFCVGLGCSLLVLHPVCIYYFQLYFFH